MDEPVITPEEDDMFECAQRTDERFPDDFREWPEPYRKASDAAIERLLKQNPGAAVISDTSECIDDSHPRFPVGDQNKGKFFAVRTVKIDRPIEQDQEPLPARHRLRAFEDEVLGKDAVRISGQIEKGHGSHFKTKLTEEQRRHHEALEHLVATEEKLAKASAHLATAEVEHKAAEEKVAQAAESADRHEPEADHVDG